MGAHDPRQERDGLYNAPMDCPGDDNAIDLGVGVSLPADALRFTFSRSGGPGGQNVNKLNTRATLTVSLEDLAEAMPAAAIERLPRRYLTDEAVVVSSSISRSQIANREHCVEKLSAAVIAAMRPRKIRRKTKPSAGAKRRRLEAKKQQGQRKQARRTDRNPPRD